MRLIYSSLVFTLLLCTSLKVSAQQPVNPDEEYTIENVFGIKNATNGGLISAVYYRHSRMLANDNLMHLGIELSNTKHPRETRETTFTGSNFIFGKTNYLISIRPTYGREKIFFKKAPQQGVRISGMVAIGPSIGLEAPYYIDLGNRSEQYDPSRHGRNEIVGNAGPFRGLFESQLVLGGFFKASLTFETNSTKNRVFGVEAGFQIESFTRDIEIIPVATNRNTFTAAFIALYFGKRR
jgi:hypothetical protein